jgi:hypothetical protein
MEPNYRIPLDSVKYYCAHVGAITSLTSTGEERNCTISAGCDGHIKIWLRGGTLVADWNINVIVHWYLDAFTL